MLENAGVPMQLVHDNVLLAIRCAENVDLMVDTTPPFGPI